MLVVGRFPWEAVNLTPRDWPGCNVTERRREADALAFLSGEAVDVVLTSPEHSIGRVLGIARHARCVQPGVRVIVLAPALTPEDVIAALEAEVYACFTLPAPAAGLRETVAEALDADGWYSGIELLSTVPHWIGLRVACRRVDADRLTTFMAGVAKELPHVERDHLLTAFREVLLNAMEHGAGWDPKKVVDVAAVRTQRAIIFYFKDPGQGFNVQAPALVANDQDPISHLEAREAAGIRAGGFGMLLTRRLVDEVHYNEKGNEVILVKHIN
jgi:anti-sigma regulatory factor (Ser/Thr protein kinase)